MVLNTYFSSCPEGHAHASTESEIHTGEECQTIQKQGYPI